MMMKNRIFKSAVLAGSLLTAVSCGNEITVMTYNVGAFGKFEDNSMPTVARIIKTSEADIVALNELDSCNARSGIFQAKELAEAMGGWDHHFARAFPFAGGAYGNGVISNKAIIDRHRIALPVAGGEEPRSAAVVETEDCVFASVHLDHVGREARMAQAEALNKWFTEHYSGYDKPVILCGDFNDSPDSDVIQILCKEWVLLTGDSPTYPSDAPKACIDYIFAFKSAKGIRKTISYGTRAFAADSDIASASDHCPVCLTISY